MAAAGDSPKADTKNGSLSLDLETGTVRSNKSRTKGGSAADDYEGNGLAGGLGLGAASVASSGGMPRSESQGSGLGLNLVSRRHGSRQVTVTFAHISLDVSTGRGRKREWRTLLKDVSGYARSGELTAVLGPSGSGKSTLLDLIAGRKTSGRLAPEGTIFYNGARPTSSMLRRDVGYVEQRESLLPLLTPFEMLRYTAELKYPRGTSAEEKTRLVVSLIEKLSLEECQHTRIGSALQRGVSGGEAKRTSVGISMIARPAVLLCDEPTSGLDSFSAHSVVAALRELAAGGISILSTIHSPPPDTFALFDCTLVMQRGRVVYFGSNGEPCEAYFAAHFPHLRTRRPTEGISDYILDVTSSANKEGPEAAAAFADAYESSDLKRENDRELEALEAAGQAATAAAAAASSKALGRRASSVASVRRALRMEAGSQGTSTPWWFAIWVLLRYRSVRAYSRPEWLLPRIIGPAIPVFLLVTVYWAVGDNLEASYATTIAAILFMSITSAAYGSMGLISTLVNERAVFLRERADGLYTALVYLLYKCLEELSVAILISLPYNVIVFYLVKLQGSLALFWLVNAVTTAIAIVLALLAGSLSSNLDVAGAMLPAYTTALLYFSGFLIPYSKIPVYWRWFSVICYLRYSWGALMASQFAGDRNIVAFGGEPVLNYFDLDGVDPWAWLGWEFLFLAFFFLATLLALSLIRHQSR